MFRHCFGLFPLKLAPGKVVNKSSVAFFCMILIVLFSCVKKDEFGDPKLPDYTPDAAAPLVYTTLGLEQLVKEDTTGKVILGAETNGLYYLLYEDILSTSRAEDSIKIPDQNIPFDLVPLGNYALSYMFDFSKNGSNMGSLQTAEFKSGDFTFDVSNPNLANFTVTITFPDIKHNTTKQTFTMSKNSGGAQNFSLTGNLADYIITFPDYPNSNSINYNVAVNYAGPAGPLFSGTITFSNLKYRLLTGQFSTINLGYADGGNEISVFENILTGNIYFADPQASFIFDNSYGVAVNPVLQYFQMVESNGNITEIDAGDLEAVAKTIKKAPYIGGSDTTLLYINATNSKTSQGQGEGLNTALSKGPQKIEYSVRPDLLPGTGFIKDDSHLEIKGQIKIPFYGRISEYSLQDTLQIQIDSIDELEFAEVFFFTQNKIPVELKLQAYFVDSSKTINGNWKVIDSVFKGPTVILASPSVDNNGTVINPAMATNSSKIYKEDLYKVTGATHLLIKASLNTNGNPNKDVKFYKSSNLQMQVSVHAKGKINLND